VGSRASRVLVSARRFRALQAAPEGREIRDLAAVDAMPRSLQSAEENSAPPPERK